MLLFLLFTSIAVSSTEVEKSSDEEKIIQETIEADQLIKEKQSKLRKKYEEIKSRVSEGEEQN